eukprot:TRINITY_DN1526_c0_g1_i1.p1 TRINITY_DN1526_c0_g1~~TRINITY_DN1526_c0_g1_i1.p1  ORF type:complete len:258 (+),score=7.55 TRINITY_DN1526_c0_g1_i1:384-1157(+)
MTLFTVLFAMYYIVADFVSKKCRWGMLIHMCLIIYRILILVYLVVFLDELAFPDSEIITDRIATYIYYIGSAVLLFCLMLTLVIWIDIFIQVKTLSADVSKFLLIVRPIVIIYSIITIIVIAGCVTIQVYSPYLIAESELVVNIIYMLSITIGSAFSLYGAHLISSLKKYVRAELAAKYPILLCSGIMGILIIIMTFVYVIGNFRMDPGPYMAFNYMFLLFEVVYTILILLMLDTGHITFSKSTKPSAHGKKPSKHK